MDWDLLLRAWLHDPVDKAANIRDHVARAVRYASVVLDRDVTEAEIRGDLADQLASAYERLPMPDARGRWEEVGVGVEDGLCRIHPLSASRREVRVPGTEAEVSAALREIVPRDAEPRLKFLSLWRLAPEKFGWQPADTRCPDHSLWHHLDTTAAMAWAVRGGEGAGLLSFKIGPVQTFIAAARSLRDLLSGSFLLSHLAFAGIRALLEECGPTALIYPHLRGLPMMDLWLHEQGVAVERPRAEALARPSVPHRFLAVVPFSMADKLRRAVREAVAAEWRAIATAVHREVDQAIGKEWPGWDERWEAQIESFWDVRVKVVPLRGADHVALLGEDRVGSHADLRRLGWTGEIAPGYWQRAVEISARTMEADARVCHVPHYRQEGAAPQKCSLLGTYEQVGPAVLSDSRRFWASVAARWPEFKADVGGPAKDRLCAISMVKRRAFPAYFRRRCLGLGWDEFGFPDTHSLAGADKDYYALLAMDGDDMGGWLSGEKSPLVEEILHPKMLAWQRRQPGTERALQLRRPVSPALHASISEALTRFAVEKVPAVVERHGGRVIYAGGDDVLAALPVERAVACAGELRQAFRDEEAMGRRATCSAGLVVAHVKEDLRYALEAARRAEQQSKARGKDRITVAALRRSGEHSYSTCCWDYLASFQRQVEEFGERDRSDRWTYVLWRQMAWLEGLPPEAFRTEMTRLLEHGEKTGDPKDWLTDLEAFLAAGGSAAEFVALAQTASFLVRGRGTK